MVSLRVFQDPWAFFWVVAAVGAGVIITTGLMMRFTGMRRHVVVGIFLLGYVMCAGGSAVWLGLYSPWLHALHMWDIRQYDALSGAGCDTGTLDAAYRQAIASAASVRHISEFVANVGEAVVFIMMLYLVYDMWRSQRAGRVESV